jgi:uncharacterized membrane protein YgdD (TMEM256/DUF423 family)
MPVRHLTFWKPKVQVVFITRNTQMLVIGHFLRIRAKYASSILFSVGTAFFVGVLICES